MYGTKKLSDGTTREIISALLVIRILCLIALSYPSSALKNAEYKRRGDAVYVDYLPGVRFINFLLAWGKIDFDKSEGVDVLYQTDMKCRATMPGRYVALKEILLDWREQLSKGQVYHGLDRARADCCGTLIDADAATTRRLVQESFSFVSFNMPLYIVRSDGEGHSQYITGRAFVEDFVAAKTAADRDFALYQFFSGQTKEFVCPFAKGGCSSRVPSCSQPVTDLGLLPLVPGCLVRGSLGYQGFRIEQVEEPNNVPG